MTRKQTTLQPAPTAGTSAQVNIALPDQDVVRYAIKRMALSYRPSKLFQLPPHIIYELCLKLVQSSEPRSQIMRWLIDQATCSFDDNTYYLFVNRFRREYLIAWRELCRPDTGIDDTAFTPGEVAEKLQVTVKDVMGLVDLGELRALRIDDEVRIPAVVFRAYLYGTDIRCAKPVGIGSADQSDEAADAEG